MMDIIQVELYLIDIYFYSIRGSVGEQGVATDEKVYFLRCRSR